MITFFKLMLPALRRVLVTVALDRVLAAIRRAGMVRAGRGDAAGAMPESGARQRRTHVGSPTDRGA